MKPTTTKQPGHTPGPWKIGREDYAYFEHGGNTIKCQTCGIDGANGDADIARVVIGDPSGEGRANATLIESAPDLLEALQSLCGWSDEAVESDPQGFETDIANAQAIITKATGGDK